MMGTLMGRLEHRSKPRLGSFLSRVRYFSTSTPGSGIFLPIGRAVKAASPASSPESVPPTPATPSLDNFNLNLGNSNNYNSPTPAKPKFSQSVGPGARRAPSPALRPKSRPSLPRPESPLRRAQNTSTPAGRPSFGALNRGHLAGPRFAASPTPNKSNGPITRDKDVDNSIPDRKYSARASQDAAGDDLAHLRTIIQEKNEKIAMLTNEFDAHRADFRSTIDTLELASSETERVYEKRIEDLLEERRSLLAQSEDVGSVALQLKQLEEVVQELEEGLEDARRGEAEARGEVEFLRGEVERVRAELRKEREQNSQAASIMSAETLQAEETPSTDQDKWCALCEGDGHDSISCPFDKT